ncbi:MAG: WYL domain-containing protein [Saprospiraceae bacterium]|jgi:predicted DNA-binding transcriptional regulator YafY|nr:WYL domain-containing protein [Saprospiraceae bacterium]MBP8097622.1 WYL domain-containing protein [Saprospiraceae bacterium]
MPINKNALIRYKVLDACFRNRQRKWTLDMLIDKVSDALYEYEGISKGASIRTVQYDIQMMRSDKLGYNAPIIVVDKKYYTYEDPKYSITNLPISHTDMQQMSEAVELLKQFKGFEHFSNLNDVVQKLEDHVYSTTKKQPSIIHFEKNERLTGIHFLDELYKAIQDKKVLKIEYKSFKAESANIITFHPWWLKEYKNRWFLFGLKAETILNLALDRILTIETDEKSQYKPSQINSIDDYFKDVIGVTVSLNIRAEHVKLWVDAGNAPYVETKPLHQSQEIFERNDDGSIIIGIKVQLNFELEREILGFGASMIVISPKKLRKRIAQTIQKQFRNYLPEPDTKS